MVSSLTHCPTHWALRCYPCECTTTVKNPKPADPQPKSSDQPKIHNVVYLIDEHNVTNKTTVKPVRNGSTIQKRYAWHYSVANLNTFNVGEIPDTIQLHEQISNPQTNKNFRWEGFMYDIPGGNAACRVGIVAGADTASDNSLTGAGGNDKSSVDRVVGFAGTYTDNKVPIGPLVQVRRDDQYRLVGASYTDKVQLKWHLAYYITKDTPKVPSAAIKPVAFDGGFTLGAEGGDPDHSTKELDTDAYDQLLDQNVADTVPVVEGGSAWGGLMFGFTTANVDPLGPDDALKPYNDSAIDELNPQAQAVKSTEVQAEQPAEAQAQQPTSG